MSNPVGRTQKTSFPLSSNSKASLCSDFKTNPNSCEQIQVINIRHFTVKALAIHHGREYHEWLVENITWKLGDSLHWNLANGNCPWLGEASFQTFCLTARAYLNTQKCGLFCRLSCPSNESPHWGLKENCPLVSKQWYGETYR